MHPPCLRVPWYPERRWHPICRFVDVQFTLWCECLVKTSNTPLSLVPSSIRSSKSRTPPLENHLGNISLSGIPSWNITPPPPLEHVKGFLQWSVTVMNAIGWFNKRLTVVQQKFRGEHGLSTSWGSCYQQTWGGAKLKGFTTFHDDEGASKKSACDPDLRLL